MFSEVIERDSGILWVNDKLKNAAEEGITKQKLGAKSVIYILRQGR